MHMKKRFRSYGFVTGILGTGRSNSISDVRGVEVGHFSKIRGKDIRTGVTIIDPGIRNIYKRKLPAAIAVGNGYGKLTGYTQVEELGTIETPIALTGSGSVFSVAQGVFELIAKLSTRMQPFDSINAVVGEINDGRLNAIHKNPITSVEVLRAYKNCRTDFRLGNVGGGVGARAFSWKGGIGTASRTFVVGRKKYTLGALVQTNFGGALTMLGVPIGKLLGKTDFDVLEKSRGGDGSCIIVLATDAPCTARQLKRIARRAFVGLSRTGSVLNTTSGDYAIAFSTSRTGIEGAGEIGRCILDHDLTAFFVAAAETTEEAIYDALFAAETMVGRDGNILHALPKGEVVSLLARPVPRTQSL